MSHHEVHPFASHIGDQNLNQHLTEKHGSGHNDQLVADWNSVFHSLRPVGRAIELGLVPLQ